ncbi:unnamed protein product [Durusdinium trenchii]|uniref:Uncharacterized protein n=1 Tax=Durusdinium trenchii TaxID=1381693 RepID=A0ABP0Q4T3_9DINO
MTAIIRLGSWAKISVRNNPGKGENSERVLTSRDLEHLPIEARNDPLASLQCQVQQSSSETVQSIPLTSCKGASTWKQFFTTPGSLGPILVAMMLWAVGCFLYAVYATPQIPMVAPEIFYQQVQEQIENIPVPKDSPHYSHYRRYYLEQYREHLAQYREHEEAFRLNKGPRVHWGALLQGLGIGTWIFVAVLAFCEYRYTTVTVSMEMVEAWRGGRAVAARLDAPRPREEEASKEEGEGAEGGLVRRPSLVREGEAAEGASCGRTCQEQRRG